MEYANSYFLTVEKKKKNQNFVDWVETVYVMAYNDKRQIFTFYTSLRK